MEDWGLGRRAVAGLGIGLGFGALAGGMEVAALAAREKFSLSALSFALLGAVVVAGMSGAGAALAAVTSPLHAVLARARPSTSLTAQATLIGASLCAWYLVQGALVLLADDRAVPAAAMAAMPLGFAGVIHFNARYFLRRAELGKPRLAPWPASAFAGAAALVALSTVAFALRNTGGAGALDDDRNVVLITVDGWRRDAAPGPALQAVISGGAWFSEAVTPAPAVRAANASALTGLHPLRHRVIFDDMALDAGYTSIAELLEREGYATGAFVSSPPLDADSGLAQGFRVYDDDFSSFIPGLHRMNAVKVLGFGRSPNGRSGEATLDRFEAWFEHKSDVPFLAWIQLPAGADPDPWIGRVDALIHNAGVADETLLVVAGTRGEARTHGASGENGLHEDVIRVPLAIRAPGVERAVTAIPQQVRLMDIPGSAVAWLGLAPLDAEGVDLLEYVSGRRAATVWCALVGRTPDGEGVRIGLRNNGVKYLKDLSSGSEQLFHVPSDPAEAVDLRERQPEALAAARLLLGPEELRLTQLLGQAP